MRITPGGSAASPASAFKCEQPMPLQLPRARNNLLDCSIHLLCPNHDKGPLASQIGASDDPPSEGSTPVLP
jgi:hypothetical protein